MRISRFAKPLFLVLATLSSSLSFAESGFYLGGSIGNASVGLEEPDPNNLSIDLDGDDFGYKIYGGFQFTALAVEGGYVDFGTIEGSSDNSIGVTGLNVFGKLSMGLGPIEVFAKAGGFVWESDYEQASAAFKEDGFDPAMGLGASFTWSDVSFRAEYEQYFIDDFDEVSMFSAGVTLWFL